MTAPTTGQWLRLAAVRVYDGSGRLILHLGRRTITRGRGLYVRLRGWVTAADGWEQGLRLGLVLGAAALGRKVGVSVGVWAYQRAESGAWSWLLYGAAGVWLVASYRAGRPGWEPKSAKEKTAEPEPANESAEDASEQEPVEQTPAVSLEKPQPPVPSPVALVAAVRDIGTPHAQLKPLAEHLGTTTDAVRAAAAGMAWAVKDVRMQGRSASAGLRWDEAPSPSEAYPFPGVVGAGQAADDDNDDAPFTTVPDEYNPVRTHVVWRDH